MKPASEVEAAQSQAIARREPVPIVPTSFDEAMRIASVLAKADLIPEAFRGKPENVLLVVLTGLELGLSPVQALSDIDVIKGKRSASAALRMALVVNSPVCEYFTLVETTAKSATYVTRRRGAKTEVRMSFTLEQAQREGLAGKDQWQKMPDLMLRKRCQTRLIDEVYPDVVRGMLDKEEMSEVVDGGTLRRLDLVSTKSPPPPPTQAREPEPALAADPTTGEVPSDELELRIQAARTVEEVDGLFKEIGALPKDARRGRLGNLLMSKKAELKRGGA